MMNAMTMPQNEVALRILKAADELMAKVGMHNISTHKIAKEAGVSVGTIYLYFKDKDDLLNKLVMYLFESYQQYIQDLYDPRRDLFEQYQMFWRFSFEFMRENPNVLSNWYQYQSLPGYRELMQSCMARDDLVWSRFIKAGQTQGIIANLDAHLMFVMTIKVAWEVIQLQAMLDKTYSDEEIDQIIQRTWKAMTI